MIGQEIRDQVFRDTRSVYLKLPEGNTAPSLLRFARKYGGKRVLDFGCATGDYCVRLAQAGFSVSGIDIHPEYIQRARERGVDAHLITDRAPFADKSFDTVLVFEVLEHVEEPGPLLQEVRRLTRGNVLITVPHSGNVDRLRGQGLLYEHFGDLDHKNFFTETSLRSLLKEHFPRVKVWKGNALNPFALIPVSPIRSLGRALARSGIVPLGFHFRLYAVASVK